MVLFLTGLGMILQWNGDNIRNSIVGLPPSFKLEFAGAVIATLFSVSLSVNFEHRWHCDWDIYTANTSPYLLIYRLSL